jgi:hypothetical protein
MNRLTGSVFGASVTTICAKLSDSSVSAITPPSSTAAMSTYSPAGVMSAGIFSLNSWRIDPAEMSGRELVPSRNWLTGPVPRSTSSL